MVAKNIKQSGRGVFKPRARIMRTIGDELISSEMVALTELVKNAYDADATRVLVRFNPPLDEGVGSIDVIDNGHGMSLDTILNTWLEPATNFRKMEKRSKDFKRRVLGEKGIGRFAAARLAEELMIITRQKNMDHEVIVNFDWKQFDDEEKYLSQVKVKWKKGPPKNICDGGLIEVLWDESEKRPQSYKQGTILRLQKLRVSWLEDQRFRDLRTDLSRLISPFQHKELVLEQKKPFQIFLSLPEPFSNYSGLVETSETFKNPHYSISGNIDKDGNYELDLMLKDQPPDHLSGQFSFKDGIKPNCGPFYIELHIWDRDNLGNLADQTNSTVKDIRKDLDAVAGINIYRDGFRVLPYGEPKNDWLRLDLRRVNNPTLRLSNNQIVGYILITSDHNPQLRDQSNREGIIASKAFEDLQVLTKDVLAVFEPKRYQLRRSDDEQKLKKLGGIFVGFNFREIVEVLKNKYPNDNELLRLVEDKSSDLETRIEDAQEIISRYRRLSTLGQLIDTILHDGRTPVSKINTEAAIGKRAVLRALEGKTGLLPNLASSFDLIENQSAVLSRVFQKIEPFGGRKRGKPTKMSVEKAIADAFAVLETEIAQIGVRVNLPQTNTEMLIESSEIQQVIINLLQNSLYWLERVSKDTREILVQLKVNASGIVEILFSDSGPGIDTEYKDLIFHPYFSLKSDGVGLGLAIAGEIISEFYDGELQLVDNGPLSGANFRIILHERG